jgi:UDP-GlcNAc:undecaprenyl-phosphate GlcNAc-1-phosphate transferase
LLAQIAAASLAFAAGFHIDAVQLPLVGSVSMGVFAGPVTVLWIVGIVNAINLIDGLDGLAAGIVFFAGVTNFVVALVSQNTFVCALMATMLGSVLGFLFFNFNPARIFMGDSGSYFLGFLLGTTSVVGGSQTASTAVSILVPVLALGVPIFDTLFAMVRRYLERRPFFSPDRGHVHHRLLDMGITHRRAVLLLYGISMVLTIAAIGVSLGHNWQVGVAILTASIVVVGLVRFLGYFEYVLLMRRQRARLTEPDTEALRRMLPEAVTWFGAAATDEDVWRTLQRVLGIGNLAMAELVQHGLENQLSAWAGVTPENPEMMVSARFPLGEDRLARAELRFRWWSPRSDVSPQAAALLQVLVDVITSALVRVNSPHAPMLALDRPEPDRLSSPQPLRVEP